MKITDEIRGEIRSTYREPGPRPDPAGGRVPGGLWAYRRLQPLEGPDAGYIWLGAGFFLAALRLVPAVFGQVYRLWIGLSVTIGYFVSRAILSVVFFLVITPTGIIMRILGKDPMERKIDPAAASYWQARDQSEIKLEDYERQF